MTATVDARGLSCPQPVLLTMDQIRSGKDSSIVVLVDTEASRENVIRAATAQGWQLDDSSTEGDAFKITLSKA